MNVNDLDVILPHASRAVDAFTAWLDEKPQLATCLAQAIQNWLKDDGAGAEDTGYEYQSWLETVIYILLDWTVNPERYQYRALDGTMATFEAVVTDGDDNSGWSFLSQGFYALMSTDALFHRRAQAITEIRRDGS